MRAPAFFRLITFSLLAACAAAAAAAPAEQVQECTSLSGAQQVSRFGNQYVLVHDGDNFYRLHADNCDKLALATRLEIQANSGDGQICPTGTRVVTNTGQCAISRVERIDEATFKRYRRR